MERLKQLLLGAVGVMAVCLNLVTVACTEWPLPTTSNLVVGGNPQAGRQALQEYGCYHCHTIPGLPGPHSYVGPPLEAWSVRSYIAGTLDNTPDNLMQWVRFPQEIEPGTAMPNLDVSEEAARDISAYLFTLR